MGFRGSVFKSLVLVFALALVAGSALADSATATLTSANQDHAGTWNVFGPGTGFNGFTYDWGFTASLNLNAARTVKSIRIVHNSYGEVWSTASDTTVAGAMAYPLVVFSNGTQLNSGYNQTIGPLMAGNYTLQLFGQSESHGFSGGTITFNFTDGSSVTASMPASSMALGQQGGQASPPIFTTIPDKQLYTNSGQQANMVDLSAYASDAGQNSQSLSYTIVSQSNSGVINCYMGDNIHVNCNAPVQAGTNTVTVKATDSQGLSAMQSFNVIVAQQTASPPTIMAIPTVSVLQGVGNQPMVLDLWTYINDSTYSKNQLSISVTSQSNTGIVNCYIDQSQQQGSRYLSCTTPYGGNTGTSTITVTASSPSGASASASFTVSTVYNAAFNSPYYNNSYYNSYNYPYNSSYYNYYNNYPYNGYSNYYNNNNYYNNYPYNYDNGSPPNLTQLPDVRVPLNSGYSRALIDLWSYASSSRDSPSLLSYSVVSQSNTSLIYCRITNNRFVDCDAPRSDSSGTNIVTVQVQDSAGRTTSNSFTVTVGPGYSGFCPDISIDTRTVYMNDSQTTHVVMGLRNNSYSDFRVDDLRLNDNDAQLNTSNLRFDRYISARSSGTLEFDLQTTGYAGSRTSVVYIDTQGSFTSGVQCSFTGTHTGSFSVVISGSGNTNYNYAPYTIYNNANQYQYGNSSSSCGGISLSVSDVSVPESTHTPETITLNNNSDLPFRVDTVIVDSSNVNFRTAVDSRPQSVGPRSSTGIVIGINARDVEGDKTGNVKVSVGGSLANGMYCSIDSIYASFNATVLDTSAGSVYNPAGNGILYGMIGTGNAGTPAGLSIDFSLSSVKLGQDESRNVTATIKNSTGTKQCLSLKTSSARAFDVSLSGENVCVNANSSETVTMTIRGKAAGTGSAELTASYAGTSVTRFVSVEVTGPATKKVNAAVTENASQANNYTITLQNTGDDLQNATFVVVGGPDTVKFGTLTKQVWAAGEKVTLQAVPAPGFSGKVVATIKVNSSAGSKEVPIEFSVEKPSAPQGLGSGFVSLATTAGIAVGLLVLAVLVILGIISLMPKKN